MDRITALQGSLHVHLEVKPVVVSQNVGFFPRLISQDWEVAVRFVCFVGGGGVRFFFFFPPPPPPPGLFEEQDLSGSETITWVCHNFASLFKELCQEMFQNSNSGNSHQIE